MSQSSYFRRWRRRGPTAGVRVAIVRALRQAASRLVAVPLDMDVRFTPHGFGHRRRPAFAIEHEDDKCIEYSVDRKAQSTQSLTEPLL